MREIEGQDNDSPPLSKKVEIHYRPLRQYDIILSVSIPLFLVESRFVCDFQQTLPILSDAIYISKQCVFVQERINKQRNLLVANENLRCAEVYKFAKTLDIAGHFT